MQNTKLTMKQRFKLSRFFQGEAPASGSIELTQRRVFILPTRRGFGMVLTIILLLLIAFVYNNNLVYMLGFLLASIFFVTILHTYKALAGLVVQAGYAQPVFAGENAGFGVTVTNPGTDERQAISVKLHSEQTFTLPAKESKNLTLYAPTKARGWQMLDTVTFASSYPLGVFRAWSPLRFAGKVLVYPQPSSISAPFPQGVGPQESGQKHIDRLGRDEFNGVRAYQKGDSWRHIHWKAYAKGQGLYTKEYASETGSSQLWLSYESAPGNNLEERLSQLSRWLLDAEATGLNYGLWLPSGKIEPNSGEQHLAACLEALALF